MLLTLKTSPIIAIHGLANSGKDTVANIIDQLQEEHGGLPAAHYKFARPLKEACKILFGFTDEQLEDRNLKEQADSFWGFSPRKATQLLGTEYGRDLLREDVWIKRAEQEIAKNVEIGYRTIISDLRFQNEADWLDVNNAKIIYLTSNDTKLGIVKHPSEAGISTRSHYIYIDNNKEAGLEALKQKLTELYLA